VLSTTCPGWEALQLPAPCCRLYMRRGPRGQATVGLTPALLWDEEKQKPSQLLLCVHLPLFDG